MPANSSRRLRRRLVFLSLLCGYTALMLFGGCADKLILYPSTQPYAVPGTERRTVPVDGGKTVELWVARSAAAQSREPEAFVLDFIGNASRAEGEAPFVAEQWGAHPVEVWAVNYPGYGGSTGPAALKAIPPAALAAYDALAAHAVGRPIYLCGHSLGTAAALHVAAHRPVTGIVLQNPPPLRQLILGRHGWWNLWLLAGPVAMQIPGDLDSVANAKHVTAPAAFILAGHDEVVPPEYQKKVVDAYAGEKRLIRVTAAGHNDAPTGTDANALREAIEWMWRRPK